MKNWVGVLRMGALLSLGWIVAAVFVWEVLGVVWASLILVFWVFLLVRFHRAVEALARSIAASPERSG